MKKLLSIEASGNTIRGIVSQKKGRESLILDFFEEKLPDFETSDELDAYLVKRIAEIKVERNLETNKTRVLYGTKNYNFFTLEMPKLPEDELELVLKKKIEKEHENLDGRVFAYKKLGYSLEKKRDTYYIKSLEKKSIELFRDKKLKIEGMDFELYSLNRLYEKFLEEDKNILFLDLRSDRTILMIYNKKSLEVYRNLNVGLDQLLKNISEFLGVSLEEASKYKDRYGFIDREMAEIMLENGENFAPQLNLAYEIFMNKILRRVMQSIDYFQSNNRGQEIDCIKYTGEYSKILHIEELLCDKTLIKKAEPFNPLDGFRIKPDIEIESYDINTILGTLSAKKMPLSFARERKLPFKINSLYISVLSFFLFIISVNFLYYKITEYSLKEKQEKMLERLKPFSQKVDEYNKLQKKIDIIDKKIGRLEKRGGAGEFYKLLYDVSKTIPEELYFDSLNFNGSSVELRGIAVSGTGYPEEYIKKFSDKLSEVYRVELGEIKLLGDNPNVKSFDMQLEMSGGDNNEQ